jgi:hypothetical protein
MNNQLECNGQRLEGMKEDCWKPRSTMDCSASEEKEEGEEKGINLK